MLGNKSNNSEQSSPTLGGYPIRRHKL